MRVLFTSPIIEHPAAGGPQLRIENSVKALSRVCDLHVVSRATATQEELERTADFFRPYCSEYLHLPRLERKMHANRQFRRLVNAFRRILDTDTPGDADFVLHQLDRIKAEVIWFGYGNISYNLMRRIRKLRPTLPLICDTDSVWSRFVFRELPYAKGLRKLRILQSGRRKENEEREWVNFCDVTTAVSEVDAEFYRGLASDKDRIRVFRNVIDVDTYSSRPPKPKDFKNPAIYLAGSFGHFHSAMDSAARWILEEVYPLLLRKVPNLHFYIVGSNSDRGFGHLNGPNITATGRLDSVLPYLFHVDVALVPLKFESGTRFKILEAGACGIPLVSTTLGAEGIPVVDGEHILIADEPEKFAEAILRILSNGKLARELAGKCNELVREQFSIDSLVCEAEEILAFIGKNKGLT